MELSSLCESAKNIVLQTGAFIRQQLGQVNTQDIEEKDLNSLVSYVDKTAEQQLVQGLSKLLPDATFFTEEETVARQDSPLQWIIDPLDGTTNFLYQLPIFSVSVALQQEGELVLGIVYEVNQDECFYAWKDGGAYMNGKPIRVSNKKTLSETLLATGFPYYDYDRMTPYLKVLETFMRKTRGIRRLGSAAVDMVYVACGRFDFFFEYSLNAWDIAGGIVIVKEAGGVVTDFSAGENYLHGQEMIASNPRVYEAVQTIIGQHLAQ